MSDIDFSRYGRLSQVFTPSAPINRRELFRGRIDQILQITSALNQPGRHVVLYGERGVGKTSLANLLADFIAIDEGMVEPTVRVNCTSQDDFRTLWAKVARELELDEKEGWGSDQWAKPDPDDIRWGLGRLRHPRIIVFDE